MASVDSSDALIGLTAPVGQVGTVMASFIRKNDKERFNRDAEDVGVLAGYQTCQDAFSASGTGGGSGNPVTFSSTTSGICTVAGATVTIVTAGTCIIAADQAGGGSYAAATQVTQSIVINKANQATLNVTATPSTLAVDANTTLRSVAGGAAGLAAAAGAALPRPADASM